MLAIVVASPQPARVAKATKTIETATRFMAHLGVESQPERYHTSVVASNLLRPIWVPRTSQQAIALVREKV